MKKLNIVQIRELLQKHNCLVDKSILPSDVKTGKKYEFSCKQGHVFESTISNAFQSGDFSCPICSGRRVLRGGCNMFCTDEFPCQFTLAFRSSRIF